MSMSSMFNTPVTKTERRGRWPLHGLEHLSMDVDNEKLVSLSRCIVLAAKLISSIVRRKIHNSFFLSSCIKALVLGHLSLEVSFYALSSSHISLSESFSHSQILHQSFIVSSCSIWHSSLFSFQLLSLPTVMSRRSPSTAPSTRETPPVQQPPLHPSYVKFRPIAP